VGRSEWRKQYPQGQSSASWHWRHVVVRILVHSLLVSGAVGTSHSVFSKEEWEPNAQMHWARHGNSVIKVAGFQSRVCKQVTLTRSGKIMSRAPVAHACNPSYWGGRDQEDSSSKPARQIVRETLSQKTLYKIGLVEWLKVKALSSSPNTTIKKKNHSNALSKLPWDTLIDCICRSAQEGIRNTLAFELDMDK
jgi:hypothetical protein